MSDITPEQASAEVVHTAKNLAQVSETARAIQNEELVRSTAEKTREAVLSALHEVFSNDSNKTPQEMKVLIQRVPILCTTVMNMHDDIKDLKDSQRWAVRIIIGAVILALLKLVLIP